MIDAAEIKTKAEDLGVHLANVQRDYVFGWLLAGIYQQDNPLRTDVSLKGGNAFRKGYFEHARFSNDLDFSAQAEIDPDALQRSLVRACEYAGDVSGVEFLLHDTRVTQTRSVVGDSSRYEARVYFKSFFAEEDLRIKVDLDIMEFDRVFLPLQERKLVHAYSDHEACSTTIQCHKLEELLAAKLKALLQRQHSPDLYDFVHAVFFQRSLNVSRREIITTFLKKTIYESNPGMAKGLFLDLPFQMIKGLWNEYLVCPRDAVIEFDDAAERFRNGIEELFALIAPSPSPTPAYAGAPPTSYGSGVRNTILEAGRLQRLLRLTYGGMSRLVEPYSLVYKRRKDGVAREYFYVWDRTGGSSGPGIKCFFPEKVRNVELTDTSFEPQFPIELAGGSGYFAKPFSTGPSSPRRPRRRRASTGTKYTIQCPVCDRKFKRATQDTRLRNHKDKYGNRCYGRTGFRVW